MTKFDEYGYDIIRNAVSKDTTILLDNQLKLHYMDQVGEFGQPQGDTQVEKSFAWYGTYMTEGLLIHLHPVVQRVVGKKLHPCYSYSRIYLNGATMARHQDRPSCEYSATFNISNDPDPWEIWFEDLKGNTTAALLNPGDMVVYQGTKLPHWRDEYKGNMQVQTFLHYVDANGQYADYRFDKRPRLGSVRLDN